MLYGNRELSGIEEARISSRPFAFGEFCNEAAINSTHLKLPSVVISEHTGDANA